MVCLLDLLNIDAVLANLEETVAESQAHSQDMELSAEDLSELDLHLSKSSTVTEVAMKRMLLRLFDDLCCWQEHSVLGTLISGLANQMAYRLVLPLKFCLYKQAGEAGKVQCCDHTSSASVT